MSATTPAQEIVGKEIEALLPPEMRALWPNLWKAIRDVSAENEHLKTEIERLRDARAAVVLVDALERMATCQLDMNYTADWAVWSKGLAREALAKYRALANRSALPSSG